jgi:hypothetical protein
MTSRSPPSSKWGRREDDDDESLRRKKLEKGKEPSAKNANEEPLFDDTKFAVELLRSVLSVYFGTPSMFITLWFGFDYGTNPPLGTLII